MRIAFVAARAPFPPNTGGRIRTFHLLKEVSQKHSVTLITAFESAEEEQALTALRDQIPGLEVRAVRVPPRRSPVRRISRALGNVADPLPYTWARYRDRRFAANLRSVLDERRHDVVHCEHVQVAHTLFDSPAPRRLLNTQNVESLLIQRLGRMESRWWRRAVGSWQARKTLRAETEACRRFDRCTAVSERDGAEIARMAPETAISIVPNGVDIDWFKPGGETRNPESPSLVFTGSMDWRPNVDAIRVFARDVLPRIRRDVPEVDLWVVGRDPHPSLVRELEGLRIRFTGTVEDVRPYLGRAHVVVVPLRIGSGTRLKILEAWAMGKAVLSTSLGAEGLPVIEGENIAIADTPERMAARAVELLRDEKVAEQLGIAGRRLVEERFAWPRVAGALLDAYEQTISGARRGSRASA